MPKEKKETVTQELTIINEPSQAIVLYKITPAEIAERLKEYDSLKVIKGDAKSYKEVRAVLTALVHTRTEVEKRRLKLGGDYRGSVEKSISNINKASEMLANPMAPYEERFRSELKTEDARLKAIEAEKVRLEEERVENIRTEIHKIQEMAMPTILGTMALENLRELSSRLEDMEIIDADYMEFTEQATTIIEDSYNAVQEAITARIQIDKEATERKVEDACLEKVRVKQEADQVIIDEANRKIKAAQKKIDDDKAAAAAVKRRFDEKLCKYRLAQLKDSAWDGQFASDRETGKTTISIVDLIALSDDKFDKIAEAHNKVVDAREKAKADKAKKDQEEFKKEATKKAEAAAVQKVLDDAKKKEEKKKVDEAEKAKKAAMAPDREKLYTFTNQLDENNLDIPKFKSKEAQGILKGALQNIFIIANNIRRKADDL